MNDNASEATCMYVDSFLFIVTKIKIQIKIGL